MNVIVLLAISDSGKPSYDSQMAERISALEVSCFACPPELLEAALKKRSLKSFENMK
ncbi:MAG: hypothetical protein SOU50_03835 [Oscillospiraceae bacterium]|nr:hypothetical protein [Oscillospiraceae bacterium]MDY2847331.1 hypothetical protein [Oscillospiraceae bacterium]